MVHTDSVQGVGMKFYRVRVECLGVGVTEYRGARNAECRK
jgi:hypothetical protein